MVRDAVDVELIEVEREKDREELGVEETLLTKEKVLRCDLVIVVHVSDEVTVNEELTDSVEVIVLLDDAVAVFLPVTSSVPELVGEGDVEGSSDGESEVEFVDE